MTISEVAKGIVVESYDGSKERMGSPRLRRTRGATALTTTTKTTVDPQRWWVIRGQGGFESAIALLVLVAVRRPNEADLYDPVTLDAHVTLGFDILGRRIASKGKSATNVPKRCI